MSWWVPLAFVGAGLAGIAIALSLTAGRPRTAPRPGSGPTATARRTRKSRYRAGQRAQVWNPGAFVAARGLVGVVVLIASSSRRPERAEPQAAPPREKLQRHEYEYVLETEEGEEIRSKSPREAEGAKNGRSPASRPRASSAAAGA